MYVCIRLLSIEDYQHVLFVALQDLGGDYEYIHMEYN